MIFGSKRKKKKEQLQVETEPEKMSLYLLVDTPKIGLVQYMKENKVEIKGIFYDIMEANYGLMQEDGNTRICIIDTGIGTFSKVENREEIISLIGMCQTENKKATVFYTDTAFKSAISKSMPKTDIVKYVSTLGIVEKLEEYNEEYIYGGAEDEVVEGMLQFRGNEHNYKSTRHKAITLDLIGPIIGTKENTVRTFETKY